MSASRSKSATPTSPTLLEVDQPAPAERYVDGVRVVSDEPMLSPLTQSNGWRVPFRWIRVLTLEDGTVVNGCSLCDFVGDRGEIQRHRRREHAEHISHAKRDKTAARKAAENIDQAPQLHMDAVLASLTLGELFDLAAHSVHWGDLLATAEQQLEDWKTRALRAEAWQRRVITKMSQLGFQISEDSE